MGLMQKALETYENMQHLAGVYEADKEPLAPECHIITNADIEIVLNGNGDFVKAIKNKGKNREKIIIPATVGSMARTSSTKYIYPHALSEQLKYLIPNEPERYNAYIKNLALWIEFEGDTENQKKLNAIYQYVTKGTILEDLAKYDYISLNSDGYPNKEKLMICWSIIGIDKTICNLWKDIGLMHSFCGYCKEQMPKNEDFCYISGNVADTTIKNIYHLKGVVSNSGNAKIISSNDVKGYTYRGRFWNSEECLSVNFSNSQKAHNALKWLVANDAITWYATSSNQTISSGRTFLCWNPKGIKLPQPNSPLLFKREDIISPTHYREELKEMFLHHSHYLGDKDDVVIAAFEAPTKGRLSVTYYNELKGSDFLDRLYKWDSNCCWPKENRGVCSPGLADIIHMAFGVVRTDKENKVNLQLDEKLFPQQIQRLLVCKIDGSRIPLDVLRCSVEKAGKLYLYGDGLREHILSTTCAVVKKYRYDHYKEDWEMALQEDSKDISYQYGRLMAVLEKAERDTYEKDEKREPTAIRMQPMFIKRPFQTAAEIIKQLKQAYYPKLYPGQRIKYEKLIGSIFEEIDKLDSSVICRGLKETYLLGYYLQKNELYSSNDENKNIEEE